MWTKSSINEIFTTNYELRNSKWKTWFIFFPKLTSSETYSKIFFNIPTLDSYLIKLHIHICDKVSLSIKVPKPIGSDLKCSLICCCKMCKVRCDSLFLNNINKNCLDPFLGKYWHLMNKMDLKCFDIHNQENSFLDDVRRLNENRDQR